jgi:hypothetical protein
VLKRKEQNLKPSKLRLWLKTRKLNSLLKHYNSYLSKHESIGGGSSFTSSSKKRELEYNRSLLMPMYHQEVVEDVARKKLAPKVINNLKSIKHKYGEDKKKEYEFRLAVAEVMEDVCRINNWTSKQDLKDHGVLLDKVFRDLFKASVEYSDVLKYYAKRNYDNRKTLVSKI